MQVANNKTVGRWQPPTVMSAVLCACLWATGSLTTYFWRQHRLNTCKDGIKLLVQVGVETLQEQLTQQAQRQE